MFTSIHHVGYLVNDMDVVLASLEGTFGAKVEARRTDKAAGRDVAFVRMGDAILELMLRPSEASGGPVGMIPHHIAYLVPDIDAAIADLLAKGVRFAAESPTQAINGTKIIYFAPECTNGTPMHLVAL